MQAVPRPRCEKAPVCRGFLFVRSHDAWGTSRDAGVRVDSGSPLYRDAIALAMPASALNSQFFHAASTALGYSGRPRLPL
jgi:hypothetical protein